MSGEDSTIKSDWGSQVVVSDGSRISEKEIEAIEEVMQVYCSKWFEKHGFRPSEFEIKLSQKQNAIMWIIPGDVIQVNLRFPYAFDNINSILKDIAKTYRKHRLRRTLELVPYAIRREGKKWFKQIFKDESEIILDLVPKRRIQVTRRETIIFTDAQTGISVEHSISKTTNKYDGEDRNLWFKLSRRVLDERPDTLEELKDD